MPAGSACATYFSSSICADHVFKLVARTIACGSEHHIRATGRDAGG